MYLKQVLKSQHGRPIELKFSPIDIKTLRVEYCVESIEL